MLTMKDIIKEGHPTLSIRAKSVALPLSDEDKTTLKLMMEFLINSQDDDIAEEHDLRAGVGLAAPQINISKRFMAILAWDERDEVEHKYLLVNPKLTRNSIARTYIAGGEGCLSVDREVEGLVSRYKKITVVAHNYNLETNELEPVELKLNGYIGVVFQHELDHLNGILFIDKLQENLDGVEPIEFIDSIIENLEEK
ncbi:MAG: peptide deformylase [Candidatus Izemoplasma sp.]